jgi:fused signal recognition particle receptor
MFQFLKDKLLGWRKKAEAVTEVVGDSGRRIPEDKLEEVLAELEVGLMEADVAQPVIEEVKAGLRAELAGRRLTRALSFEDAVERVVRDAVGKSLAAKPLDLLAFVRGHEKPVVIMFVGVNGTGKTTAIAKLTHLLQRNGLSVVLAAGDTFRAGAIEQIAVHAERLGAKLIRHAAGADPAAVAYDAIEHARAKERDVVLIDTAGRMQTNVNLMDQMKKIQRVAKPHLTIFVGDALAGNDAVEQARQFHEAVGFDGAILTKIDADAKGGAALSITRTTGAPILFVGTGQGYEDLQAFDAKWMTDRLFGGGRP